MGVKKIRSVFMQYALLLAFTVFIIVAVNAGIFFIGVNSGAIYPLVSIEAAINNAKANLQAAEQIKEDEIPLLCDYAIFTMDGQYTDGSIGREAEIGRASCRERV